MFCARFSPTKTGRRTAALRAESWRTSTSLRGPVQRWWLTIAIFGCAPVAAFAEDWGMGESNAKIPPSSIFQPVSTPAHEINTVAFFVIAITGVIFVIVAGLLTYCIVRYRARPGEDDREPPQVYGSNQVELAWTVVPILIVITLFLTTAQVVNSIQRARLPDNTVEVVAIGHQYWWEYRYPKYNVVAANAHAA